ncbi:MAG: hypothetical protein Q7Q71_01500 [Verrucomicrobiota bacterium JB023]|nr:hypothetical protein [Verrucomicrobiota bacterium JB023]
MLPPKRPEPPRTAPAWQNDQPINLPQEVESPKLSKREQEALENFQKLADATPRKSTGSAARVRKMLTNPESVKDAVILAEILGPRRIR